MSPVNPPSPPDAPQKRVVAAVRSTAYKHGEEIEIALCGGVMGVAVALTGMSMAFAFLVALVFLAGAFVQAHLKRGK